MQDSIINKWNKRKCFPVQLGGDEKGSVRKLSFRQIRESSKLDGTDKTIFIAGCCICDEDGRPLIERNAEESLADFVTRSEEKYGDIDPDNLMAAMAAIGKVTTPPDQDTLAKN